jgi:hypothetical protein
MVAAYDGDTEEQELEKQLLPPVSGKVCCCELVVDLQVPRLTTSSSVENSSCNTDGLM